MTGLYLLSPVTGLDCITMVRGFTHLVFTILQFGNAYALYCVTKLLKPVCSYMHSLSILFSIYIDDIRIMSDDFHLCVEYTAFCVNVLTCGGWNINTSKSTMDPTQQLLYLVMYTDSVNMMYFSLMKKLLVIQTLIQNILGETWGLKKDLAVVLGKIASRMRSHGNICSIMTRHCQHILGLAVHNRSNDVQNWDGSVFLDAHAKVELTYFLNNIVHIRRNLT